MTSSPAQGEDHEVLALGHGGPRRSWRGSAPKVPRVGRYGAIAAVCLVLGAVSGARIDDALDARQAALQRDATPPALSAGVIEEYPDPVDDQLFAVPVYNGGSSEVTVRSVFADAWVPRDAPFRPVTIPPERWAMLALPVKIDCNAIGATAPETLTVLGATADGTFERRLTMPAASPALGDAGWRLCMDPRGSVPTAQDVYGSWLVEEAGRFRRTVVRLREGGTFAIDPDVFAFGADLNAVGTFDKVGARLRLEAGGGRDCRPGDRTTWVLTLLDDGRLHIRHHPRRASWCRVDEGEVWVARRIAEPLSAPDAP